MTLVGPREKDTQQRVIRFFRDALCYAYLGDALFAIVKAQRDY
jgi:hypothetical protein